MKKKMNNWLKRGLAGFMCMSLMVLGMLPVKAAADESHPHNYVKAGTFHTISYNEGNHTIVEFQRYNCSIFGCAESFSVEIGSKTESHDIVYTDLGEVNGIHHYKVHCKVCGFHYTM